MIVLSQPRFFRLTNFFFVATAALRYIVAEAVMVDTKRPY